MSQKQNIINQYSMLFWWVKDKNKLSDEAIVEGILCYGDDIAIKMLFDWLGVKQVAAIFYKQTQHKRVNYPKRTQHYFSLFFQRHVS